MDKISQVLFGSDSLSALYSLRTGLSNSLSGHRSSEAVAQRYARVWSRRMHRLESGEQCSRASLLVSEPQSQWHINRLELEEVFFALKDFRPQLEQQHVLIHTDNTSVVSYINHSTPQCSVQTGSESPAMGGLSLPLHQSSTHPRSP